MSKELLLILIFVGISFIVGYLDRRDSWFTFAWAVVYILYLLFGIVTGIAVISKNFNYYQPNLGGTSKTEVIVQNALVIFFVCIAPFVGVMVGRLVSRTRLN